MQSIDQGPGKASPSFQDMRNAQASRLAGVACVQCSTPQGSCALPLK